MRVNKARQRPRSIRYLLCANPTLQRISLRRISVRLKDGKKSPRSKRLKTPAPAGNSVRVPWATRPGAIVLGLMVCLMVAAALIAARRPSHGADVARVDVSTEFSAQLEPGAPAPRLDEDENRTVATAPATSVDARTHTADAPVKMQKTPAVASAPAADLQDRARVTLTGCLELDEETFWLKDTSGVGAPRSRSWKSGFLKKRPSPVQLVDATSRLQLQNHIGQRVSATGLLMNGEIRASSLQQVTASCG